MAGKSEYIHGEMPLDGHNSTFSGFVRQSAFYTAFFIVALLMPILVFGANIAWLPALIATFIVGVIITLPLNLAAAGLRPWSGLLC